jgi:hypothetical protein
MNKARFLAVFFALFAALLVLWTNSQATEIYTELLLGISGPIGTALHGWILERGATGPPTWRHGRESVDLAIQFDALAVGIVPLVALIGATPGIAPRRRGGLILAGVGLCFALHALVVVLFPLLVHYENAVSGVGGAFLGMTAFVGAPVIIWFALVFRTIRQWLPSFRGEVRATGLKRL